MRRNGGGGGSRRVDLNGRYKGPLVSIEPFRTEIVPGVFLSGAPLGTNVFGFSFIRIRHANNEDILLTWTCYNPRKTLGYPMILQIRAPTDG